MHGLMAEKNECLAIAELMAGSGVGFGTSGARGLAEAMTDRVCYAYTLGFLQYLEKVGSIRPGDEVVVGGDFRPSTPRIMLACIRAASDIGYLPINVGFLPSPAVAAEGLHRGVASMMVTGSHIPDDRNGIKFNKPEGEVLKGDESGIREQQVLLSRDLFDEQGCFVAPGSLPEQDGSARRRYLMRYLDFFPPGCLSDTQVLSYEHSTVAADVMAEVLEGLGATVQRIGRSETFVPVDTEAVREEDVRLAAEWAQAHDFDLLVSADGDGDRPLIGDETGRWLRGDVLGVLTAHYLNADAVVTPVSSNSVLELSGWFERCVRTRIGSPYVIEGMQQAANDGAWRVVGYEANGGFLTLQPIESDGRTLPALPTRDALLVAIAVLLLARRQGTSVSQLSEQLPARFTASDRLKAFPTELSQRRIEALSDGGEASMAEAFAGLGEVTDVDRTDGLRMHFANGEIVHLRPSGNAPELRCYNEADSPQRVAELNRHCMQLLDAWRE
jgi:phosphomannomutase